MTLEINQRYITIERVLLHHLCLTFKHLLVSQMTMLPCTDDDATNFVLDEVETHSTLTLKFQINSFKQESLQLCT